MSNSAFTQNPNTITTSTGTALNGYLKGNGTTVGVQATPIPKADLPTATAFQDQGNLFTVEQNITRTDSTSNLTLNALDLIHNTSATAAAGLGVSQVFKLQDTTTPDTVAADLRAYWPSTPTHGSASGGLQFRTATAGTLTTALEIQDTTFGPAVGFLGTTPTRVQNQVDVADALNTCGLTSGYNTFNAEHLRYMLPKNPVDNANFNIWQRGTSFTSVANAAYTADRWQYTKAGAVVHTVAQDTVVPTISSGNATFSKYSLKCTVTTADTSIAAGDLCCIGQAIEGFNFQPYAQQPFTLSFYMKAAVTGTYCVSFRNSGQDRSYVAEYSYTNVNNWTHFSVQVPASPSSGTWDYTTAVGVSINWAMSCGSTFQTTAGSWQTGNFFGTSNQVNNTGTVANYFQLSQIMISSGSAAGASNGLVTPMLQPISITEDLGRCQRYCNVYLNQPCGTAGGTGFLYNSGLVFWPVTMRVSPSISGATFAVNAGSAGTVSFTGNLNSCVMGNSANNWTTNAIVAFSGTVSADL